MNDAGMLGPPFGPLSIVPRRTDLICVKEVQGVVRYTHVYFISTLSQETLSTASSAICNSKSEATSTLNRQPASLSKVIKFSFYLVCLACIEAKE